MLALKLSEKMEQDLEALAKRTGKTKIYCIKKAIAEFIEDQEDLFYYEDKIKELSATIPSVEVRKIFGLEE